MSIYHEDDVSCGLNLFAFHSIKSTKTKASINMSYMWGDTVHYTQ